MANEDCYFFVDIEQPEAERCMSVLCVECHDQHLPDTGWFHEGSKEGYGPFDYQCCKCGKYLHRCDIDEKED